MGEIQGSTRVTFPAGAMTGWSTVVACLPVDGGRGIVVDETPFHPLDPFWPDQPGDVGLLQSDGLELKVVDSVTGAVPATGGEVLVGADIPVKRGDPDWHWLVVHVVERRVPQGAEIRLMVDGDRRRAFSAGHTACHLTALALNAALAGRWRKDAPPDGLGRPDFDRLAITRSRIVPGGSVDTYRLGRSLRRKGFTTEGLADALPDVAGHMESLLAGWIASGAPVAVEAPNAELTAPRTWRCDLPDGVARLPCGGTHVDDLGELGRVAVTLELAQDELVVETRTA
ncbi:alanyl-tRNA editing protein [Actinomadura rubteroloni]|uniref:metal-dependent hydrolase n=1 Tax=Actinomadura rubteroloni TaxID=1926885 RepID=UPI001F20DC72|nr:metal-dependent hydrolase [Actinomadura rubteroloni]